MFSTAGLGAIPARVTGDAAGLAAVIEDLERIKRFEFDLDGYGIGDAWRIGAFGFDYSEEGGAGLGQYIAGHPYQRSGQVPAEPISIAAFRAVAAEYLKDVCFTQLCFGESSAIVVEDAFPQIHRPTAWDQWSRPELLHPVAPRPLPPTGEV